MHALLACGPGLTRLTRLPRLPRLLWLSALASPIPIAAAAADFSPGLSVGMLHDGEPRRPAAAAQPWVGTLLPELRLDAGSRVRVHLLARQRYEATRIPVSAGSGVTRFSFDRASDHAALRAAYGGSSSSAWRLSSRVTRSRDLFDIEGQPTPRESEVTRWGGATRAHWRRGEGTYQVEGWSHRDTKEPDVLSLSWNLAMLPFQIRNTALVAGWRQRQARVGTEWALRERRPAVGIRHRLTPAHWAQIELGASQIEIGSGPVIGGPFDAYPPRVARGPALTLLVDGPVVPDQGMTAEITVQKHLPATAKVAVRRALGSAGISAAWESVLDADGRFDPGLHRLIRWTLGLQDTLARANVIGLELAHAQARRYQAQGADARVTRATGWLLRRMRPWLTGRASISYLERHESRPQGQSPLRRIRLEAVLGVRR